MTEPLDDDNLIEEGKLQLLLVQPFGRGFGRVQDKFASEELVQVVLCGSATEALQLARQLGSCVILGSVSTHAGSVRHLAMLRGLAEPVASGLVRVLLTVAQSNEDLLLDRLEKSGVTELMPEPVPEKSLIFKIDRAIRALPAYKKLAMQRVGNAAEVKAQVWQEPPLTIRSDCWVTQGGGARQLGGRWTIRLLGPGPSAGRWVELNAKGQRDRCWQWMPSNPLDDPFIVEGGIWYFRGQEEPELKGTVWWFIGARPSLEFIIAGAGADRPEERHARFYVDDSGALHVTQDSERPIEFLQALQASMQKPPASVAPVAEAAAKTGPQIRMIAPLELASDCWIYGQGRVKRVGERWAVRLVGPGPGAGRWVQLRTKSIADGEPFWRWVPHHPDKDPFMKEQGSWICRGLQPRFEHDEWLFVSKRPSLSFYHERESYGSKLATDIDGTLVVARDSEQALNGVEALRASVQLQMQDSVQSSPAPADSLDKIEEVRKQAATTVRPERMGARTEAGKPWEGPEASALAVAFYVSEIIAKRGNTAAQLAERYCRYLSGICGGARFELWYHRDGIWGCAGTSDGTPGSLSGAAARALEDPAAVAAPPEGASTLSVGVTDATGRILGALALEGAQVARVPVPFAQATAALSVGILRSLVSAKNRAA